MIIAILGSNIACAIGGSAICGYAIIQKHAICA